MGIFHFFFSKFSFLQKQSLLFKNVHITIWNIIMTWWWQEIKETYCRDKGAQGSTTRQVFAWNKELEERK